MPQYTDLSYLTDFTDNDPDLMKEGIQMYLTRSPQLLQMLLENTKNKNWKGIHDSAHSLYSSTQIVGISSLAKVVKDVETMAREERDYEDIKSKVQQIEKVMTASFAELNQYLASTK